MSLSIMSFPKKLSGALACWMILLSSTVAAAQSDLGDIRAETFRPNVSTRGILDSKSADTGGAGAWDVGLWAWYAQNPLVVVERTADSDTEVSTLVGTRIGGSLTAAYSFLDWLELGLEIPYVAYQTGDETSPLGGADAVLQNVQSGSLGLGNITLWPKFQLLRRGEDGRGVDLAFNVGVALQTTTPAGEFMGEPNMYFMPSLLLSNAAPIGFRWVVNVGANIREAVEINNVDLGHELDGRLGLGYGFERGFGVEASVRTNMQIGSTAEEFHNPVVAHLGIRQNVTDSLQFFAGAGTAIISAPGTPDFRVFAGFRLHSDGCDDADGDGWCDSDDACPNEAEDDDGFEDQDGCPDLDNDGDGIPDVRDACPNKAETVNAIDDEDGCPDEAQEPDTDGDGIVDSLDECPDEPGVPERAGCPNDDQDGDGVKDIDDACPDIQGPRMFGGCPDTDGDGISDPNDACPDEPEVINLVDDDDGCPDVGKTLVKIEGDRIELRDSVYFKSGKSTILKKSYNLLRQVAAVMRNHMEIKRVRIEGHTDNQGSNSLNQRLSESRAKSVYNFLVGEGVEPERMEYDGFGEDRPIADNATREGRAQNRRVDFFIVEYDK